MGVWRDHRECYASTGRLSVKFAGHSSVKFAGHSSVKWLGTTGHYNVKPADCGSLELAGCGSLKNAGCGSLTPAGCGSLKPAGCGSLKPAGCSSLKPAGCGSLTPAGCGSPSPPAVLKSNPPATPMSSLQAVAHFNSKVCSSALTKSPVQSPDPAYESSAGSSPWEGPCHHVRPEEGYWIWNKITVGNRIADLAETKCWFTETYKIILVITFTTELNVELDKCNAIQFDYLLVFLLRSRIKNHLARCQTFIQSSNFCSEGKLCSNRVVDKLWDTIKLYIYIY